ncbi:MAG TPA: sulfatase-like hydrolase/transferase, partial [Vicinamibacterales bacterium]|nr:sulfatase-like hydrolase/transferase [Vicinamibacterales bacterium]
HDSVIGQLIDHLRSSGKFDDALVIMTSDHSWRPDPMEPIANWTIDPSRRRVPLYIKLPHQQQGQLISKTVYNNLSLRPIIETVLRNGQLTDAQIRTLIDGLEQLPTPTGKNSVRPGSKDSDLP